MLVKKWRPLWLCCWNWMQTDVTSNTGQVVLFCSIRNLAQMDDWIIKCRCIERSIVENLNSFFNLIAAHHFECYARTGDTHTHHTQHDAQRLMTSLMMMMMMTTTTTTPYLCTAVPAWRARAAASCSSGRRSAACSCARRTCAAPWCDPRTLSRSTEGAPARRSTSASDSWAACSRPTSRTVRTASEIGHVHDRTAKCYVSVRLEGRSRRRNIISWPFKLH